MRYFLSILVIALLVGACTPQQQRDTQFTTTGTYTPKQLFDPEQEISARAFSSQEELQAFVQSAPSQYYGGVYMERSLATAQDSAGGMAKSGVAPAAAPEGYSGTNNQVAGVDEADILKTDGNYIYTVTGTTLFIIKAYPGEEAAVVKTIELTQYPSGLFVDGDRLAVFGGFYDMDYFKSIDYVPRQGMTYFNIYDISDKTSPQLVKEYKFEGNYFQARMHNDYVYFVVTSGAETRDNPTPIIMDGTTMRNVAVSDVYYYPVPYDSIQFATVHAINIQNPDGVNSKTLAVEWDNKLYMSEQNIFLASTENINEWQITQAVTMELLEPRLTEKDRQLIDRIKSTDDDILSSAEKESKIFQVYQSYVQYMNSTEAQEFQDTIESRVKEQLEKYESLSYTIINRISIENGQVDVKATGKVPGSLNNQFSMDEYNGVLRVATTLRQSNWWGEPRPMPVDIDGGIATSEAMPRKPVERPQSVNHVYTLDADMNVLGKLTGLAEEEQIFSTRFIGDRLYMVTFRQVDPFFVIDLSDPSTPKELGQLKIPGFSRYLHPYDENTLIGIGRDASDTGRQRGLKISLFDVSDVTAPKEIAKFVEKEENSQSAAEWEHKAFLFDREKQLLVIPAYSYSWEYKSGAGKENYNGAMVFNISRSGIEMRGIIDHSTGSQYYGAMVERSLWIDDLLYTKSPNLLRINRIEDLGKVKSIELKANNTPPYPVY